MDISVTISKKNATVTVLKLITVFLQKLLKAASEIRHSKTTTTKYSIHKFVRLHLSIFLKVDA